MIINEAIEKAMQDMLIYGSGAIFVTEDGIQCISPEEIRPINPEDQDNINNQQSEKLKEIK